MRLAWSGVEDEGMGGVSSELSPHPLEEETPLCPYVVFGVFHRNGPGHPLKARGCLRDLLQTFWKF